MNIDNTILTEILKKISNKQTNEVWSLLVTLTEINEVHTGIAGKLDHALDLLKYYSYNQASNMTGISESTLIRKKLEREEEKKRKLDIIMTNPQSRVRQGKTEPSFSQQNRFSTGDYEKVSWLPETKYARFCWWPKDLPTGADNIAEEANPILKFDNAVKEFFLWYVNNSFGGRDYAWKIIESVCENWQVDIREIDSLKAKGNEKEWIEEIIARCKFQAHEQYVTQRFIKEKREEGKIYIGARKNSPIEFFNDLGYMPSIKCGLPNESLITLEGKILKESHFQFKSPEDPKNWSSVSGVSAPLIFSDRSVRYIPYTEFIGSPRKGHFELIEGKNLSCEKISIAADVKNRIVKTNYNKAEKNLIAHLASKGYEEHPSLMWLDHLDFRLDPTDRNNCKVKLYIGTTNYIEHRIYQSEMMINDELMQEFVKDVDGIRANAENKLLQKPWTTCGGGCWLIVTDGNTGKKYIMVSYRNPAKVDELVNTLSYSSSGSFEYDDASPAHGMMREIEEELGVIVKSSQDLVLISLGVDLERYIVQFSYIYDSGLTIQEIDGGRKTLASTPGEQCIFYIDFTKEAIETFVRNCAFEPGAAYSLLNLSKKYFN